MKSITAKRAPAAGRSQGLCRGGRWAGTEWRRGLLSGADRRGSCPAQVEWEDVVRRSPQSLILSSPGTTSSGSKAPTAGRTWCAPTRNPLFLRRRAPRLPGPRRRRRAGRGAPRPAIPYSFVAGHHVFRVQDADGGPDVVRPDPQSLILSSPGTTSFGAKAPAPGWTWCAAPCNPLFLRRQAPRLPGPGQVGWEDVVRRSQQSIILSLPSTTSSGAKAPTAGKRRRCWRGLTEDKGFARNQAPTWSTQRRENGVGVGVA